MSDLLAGYETVKAVSGGKATPIVEITKSGDGAFLKGILLRKRTNTEKGFNPLTGEPVEKVTLIATFRLVESNARMVMKGTQGYAPVENVPAGSEVVIYGAPAELRRALDQIEEGGKWEVLVAYEGKKKKVYNVEGKQKSVNAHAFKVGKKAVAAAVEASSEELPD